MGKFDSATICFILVTLCWTIVLLQRVREGRARFLIAMVGLVSMFHGLRLLTANGLGALETVARYGGVVDLLVAILMLVALVIVHSEASRHRVTMVQLRLAQANERPVRALDGKMSSLLLDAKSAETAIGNPVNVPPEKLLDSLIQASPVAIVALDESGLVCTCNEAAEKLYSRDHDSLLGKPLPDLRKQAQRKKGEQGGFRPAEAHS